MKILIDADGCPVVDITVSAASKFHIPCVIICDTAHNIQRSGAETITVDQGADSADYVLVNKVNPGDLVITQDYGLASMCLARGALVMHQDGWQYTADNIDALLLERHEAAKLRRAGARRKGPKKRQKTQNTDFEAALSLLLQTTVQG